MAELPFNVKFIIPLIPFIGSLIGRAALHNHSKALKYFPLYIAVILIVAVVEKHMIMDSTFKFAYP